MGAITTLATRLAQALAVLLAVSFLVYLLLDLLPGDAAEQLVGPAYDLTPEERAERVQEERVRLGLDRPLIVRYAEWLLGMITGSLGRSVRGNPISTLITDRLGVSLEIAVISVLVALAVSIAIALIVHSSKWDWLAKFTQAASSAFIIIPQFYLAFLLVLVFSVWLGVLPSIGFTPLSENPAKHFLQLVLPITTLVLPQVATYLPYLVSGLRSSSTAPMAIAAAARGISQRRLLMAHLLPNGILPTISMAGIVMGNLLGNMVIIEFAFSIPGIGSLLLRGIGDQDLTLVSTLVVIIAAVFVLSSIITDLVYALVDPRLRKVSR
ncbi:ABC transporter permease [Schumannella luteola]